MLGVLAQERVPIAICIGDSPDPSPGDLGSAPRGTRVESPSLTPLDKPKSGAECRRGVPRDSADGDSRLRLERSELLHSAPDRIVSVRRTAPSGSGFGVPRARESRWRVTLPSQAGRTCRPTRPCRWAAARSRFSRRSGSPRARCSRRVGGSLASCAHDSNGRFSVRRRCGLLTPCLAELTSIIPHSTATAQHLHRIEESTTTPSGSMTTSLTQ